MGTFLDTTGLQALWNKIKSWVGNNYQPKGSYAASNHTHNYASTVKVGNTSYNVNSGIVSLPAYPTVPSLANYVNTVNISGSGNVITNITKNGNTVTVTKGNVGGAGATPQIVYNAADPTDPEISILQLENNGSAGGYFVEIVKNALGGTYSGGELRLSCFTEDGYPGHYLQICPLGIHIDGMDFVSFMGGKRKISVDSLVIGGYQLNISKARELGLL